MEGKGKRKTTKKERTSHHGGVEKEEGQREKEELFRYRGIAHHDCSLQYFTEADRTGIVGVSFKLGNHQRAEKSNKTNLWGKKQKYPPSHQ